MTRDHAAYVRDLQAAQAERRQQLLSLAATRPGHLAYAIALLDAANDDERMDLPAPRGVSGRVADAILDDVYWITMEPPSEGFHTAIYPNAYAQRRRVDAIAADQRARTADSLEHRLSFGAR